jgi:hypothetical protein
VNELTQERLKQILEYNSETGEFIWRVSTAKRIKIGDKAGCLHKPTGYVVIRIDGNLYRSHRLVFLYEYGALPKTSIDHLDGNPANNKLANLNECLHAENCKNRKMTAQNSSGFTGVYLQKSGAQKLNKYWIAHWRDIAGKQKRKCFSILKHGYDNAFELAKMYRSERIQEMVSLGVKYTERHGLKQLLKD